MLKKAIKGLLIVLALIFAYYVVMIFVWPPVYWADEIRGQVVDEETGAPLEGVVITANWELYGPVEGHSVDQMLTLTETVTDKEGRFVIPSWIKLRPVPYWLEFEDPQLLLFKSGYQYKRLVNERTRSTHSIGLHRHSDWNGKTIRLAKFQGNPEEYAKHVGGLDSRLDFAFRHDDCSWKKIPRMLAAIHLENRQIRKQGLPDSGCYPRSIQQREEESSPTQASTCGSIQEYLRSYIP